MTTGLTSVYSVLVHSVHILAKRDSPSFHIPSLSFIHSACCPSLLALTSSASLPQRLSCQTAPPLFPFPKISLSINPFRTAS